MARLPTPGSDDGNWGTILNDFLDQAHGADGTLKSGSVGSTQLQSGSVGSTQLATGAVGTSNLADDAVTTAKLADAAVGGTQLADGSITNSKYADSSISGAKIQNNSLVTAKLADGSITSAKLAPDVGGSTKGIRSLLIFYAPPSIVNAVYDNDYAAGILSRYDDVVLGTGLEDPANASYADTTAIIQKVAALSPDTVIWGYVDTGVTTENLPLSTIQTQIDQWISIGAKGIFLDVFGYDYQVSRSRQNSILSYVHGKGYGSIMNVWNSDDALSSAVDATYNPTGTPTVANDNDVLLLESWVLNSDSYASPFYATFSDIKTRGDKARTYRDSLGVRIFAANIMLHTGTSESNMQQYRAMAEGLARVWRLDGSGLGASAYSASGTDVGVAQPRFSQYQSIPIRPDAPYTLNGSWTQVQAADLGITINYDGTNNIHTWQQQ